MILPASARKKIILAITGASGGIVGIRLLEMLRDGEHEIHLVISRSGVISLNHEAPGGIEHARQLASYLYEPEDISARIASGSFPVDAMLVVPCSVKTLSAIANSYTDSLITRSADVCMKEGRPLILGFRETPIHRGHIRLMDLAAQAGATIFPLIPPFYGHPQRVQDLVDALAGRILLRCQIENPYYVKWDDPQFPPHPTTSLE